MLDRVPCTGVVRDPDQWILPCISRVWTLCIHTLLCAFNQPRVKWNCRQSVGSIVANWRWSSLYKHEVLDFALEDPRWVLKRPMPVSWHCNDSSSFARTSFTLRFLSKKDSVYVRTLRFFRCLQRLQCWVSASVLCMLRNLVGPENQPRHTLV